MTTKAKQRIIHVPLILSVIVGAAVSDGVAATVSVPGTSDPWLAGMTNGATASEGDVAPQDSPAEVKGVPIVPGELLTFSASGATSYGPMAALYGPEGDVSYIVSHATGTENGIASCTSPVDSLLGVFLGADLPSLSAAPTSLDFSTPESRDYTTLSPELKQVFFIGDGLTSSAEVQKVVVPLGATRLFLGTQDGFGWDNNLGSLTVEVANSSVGGECTFTLGATTVSLPAKGGTKTVRVGAKGTNCSWTAVSNDSFITITAGSNYTGNAKVHYSVPRNTNASERVGMMTIAGQTFTVNQAAAPCGFSLGETKASFSSTGGSSNVTVMANGTNCTWKAVASGSFITITAGSTGAGDGTVDYTLEANTKTGVRKGTITVGKEKLTITQSGTP